MTDTIRIENPRDIDTEPELVGGIAVEQIGTLLAAVAELMDGTTVMARSSFQSELLADEPELEASELATRWLEADLNAELARLNGTVEFAQTLCRTARNRLP